MSRLPLIITLGVGFALGLSSCQANTNNQDPTLIPPRPSGYSGAATQVAEFQNETHMLATQIAATPLPEPTINADLQNRLKIEPTYQAYIVNYKETIDDAETTQLQRLEDLGFTEAGYIDAKIITGVRFYFQPNSKFTLDQMLVELKKSEEFIQLYLRNNGNYALIPTNQMEIKMAIANPDFCLPEGDRMLSAEEPYLIKRNLTSNDPNCGAPGVTHSMVDPNYKFHNDSALIVLATDGVNRNCEASDKCKIGEIIMNYRGNKKYKINMEQLFSSTWFHEVLSVIMRLYGIKMDSNGATNEDFVSEVERLYMMWRYNIEPIE